MKKCNYCNQLLSVEDTHCKQCGMPYKSNHNKKRSKAYALCFAIMIVTFLGSFIYASTVLNNSISNDGNQLVLGEFKNVSVTKDIGLYTYDNEVEFIDHLKDATSYMSGNYLFKEDLLNCINDKYEVDHQFDAIITVANNIYFSNVYTIKLDNYSVIIDTSNDLYNELNEVVITYLFDYSTSLENQKTIIESDTIISLLTTSLFDESYDYNLIIDEFNELESQFDSLKHPIGNYGISVINKQNDITSKFILTENNSKFILKLKQSSYLTDKYLYINE